jgi:hypothetical protein
VEADDSEIHELSYNPSNGWAVGGALTEPVAAGTGLTGFALGAGGVRVYFVAAADHAIHQLAYAPATGWSEGAAMTSAVATATCPSGFPWTGCDERIYFVAAADGAVHELGYNGPSSSQCVTDRVAPGSPSPPATTTAPTSAGAAPTTITPPRRAGTVRVRISLHWRWLRGRGSPPSGCRSASGTVASLAPA